MAGDFSRLKYTYQEVLADTGVTAKTRLIYQYNEVVGTVPTPKATRLIFQYVEVIAAAPGAGGGYHPIVMSCS